MGDNPKLLLRSLDHLRAAMRLAGVSTNRQLAQAAGIASGVAGSLLSGRQRRVTTRTAEAIAEALGQPVDRLFIRPPTDLRRRRSADPPLGRTASSPREASGADGAHREAS